MRSVIEMFEHFKAGYQNINNISFQNKMYEEIEMNSKPENPEIKSETNIDWNFVLGLMFGIGYVIFTANA